MQSLYRNTHRYTKYFVCKKCECVILESVNCERQPAGAKVVTWPVISILNWRQLQRRTNLATSHYSLRHPSVALLGQSSLHKFDFVNTSSCCSFLDFSTHLKQTINEIRLFTHSFVSNTEFPPVTQQGRKQTERLLDSSLILVVPAWFN